MTGRSKLRFATAVALIPKKSKSTWPGAVIRRFSERLCRITPGKSLPPSRTPACGAEGEAGSRQVSNGRVARLTMANVSSSNQGFIYARNEYPLAVKRLVTAIRQATDYGLLGQNIAGSDFSFEMKISTGAGAFVCGESTALMASLEGEVGRPRAKYVHTVEKGFRQSPSNLNNVETYANVPAILLKGADWFSGLGTEHSKGTKVFSLVGKIKNTGLVEVPMGTSLRNIIYDMGGHLHGGCGPIFPRLSERRIVRPVQPLPGRD